MTAELFLRITKVDAKGKERVDWYAFERIAVNLNHAKLAWRLQKLIFKKKVLVGKGDTHTVMLLNSGKLSCDCQHSNYRPFEACKHRQALLDRGLLPKSKAISPTEGNPDARPERS